MRKSPVPPRSTSTRNGITALSPPALSFSSCGPVRSTWSWVYAGSAAAWAVPVTVRPSSTERTSRATGMPETGW
ncbi:hypothetical protein [[Actinomadura] parvosata]|uniref:hypothetical protein n=1 Tax=[Actinomadura] parvosata TaxID=1955412 RepID=UPI0016466F1F